MDSRFLPTATNTTRDFQVMFFVNSNFSRVRLGIATDGYDLTSFVASGTHTATDCSINLEWRDELYGLNQPRPGQIIAIYTLGQVLWIGIIQSISSFKIKHGNNRMMTISARSRDAEDIWRLTKRVTKLYPPSTQLTSIVYDVGIATGLLPDEVLFDPTGIVTAHSNTQLSSITSWEMVTALAFPMGFTPVFDNIGRLTSISRDLLTLAKSPTYILTDDQLVEINSSRVKPGTTRYVLSWADPKLSKIESPPRRLGEVTITTGFFTPVLFKDVWFSADKTQRATGTHLRTLQNPNAIGVPVCGIEWDQISETEGRLILYSLGWSTIIQATALAVLIAASLPDPLTNIGFGGFTIPINSTSQGIAELALFLTMMAIGTGVFEIWGTPYDWGHAKNTSEAYDASAIPWLDNPQEGECDFIVDENHAQKIATQELIYLSSEVNKWSVTIQEDYRMQRGDIIQFPDGSQMYVEAFTRNISRGSTNTLSVSGFLLGGGTVTKTTKF